MEINVFYLELVISEHWRGRQKTSRRGILAQRQMWKREVEKEEVLRSCSNGIKKSGQIFKMVSQFYL